MRTAIIWLVVIVLVVLGAWWAYRFYQPPTVGPVPLTTTEREQIIRELAEAPVPSLTAKERAAIINSLK